MYEMPNIKSYVLHSSREYWLNKLSYICIMEYCTTIKYNKGITLYVDLARSSKYIK